MRFLLFDFILIVEITMSAIVDICTLSTIDIVSEEDLVPPAKEATTAEQFSSIAELPKEKKYSLYERITEEDLINYHRISCRPITKKAEDDMELVSDIITWGERYLHHWGKGIYFCSRCRIPLYSSEDKYKGPCIWPSFRQPIAEVFPDSVQSSPKPIGISTKQVYPYNKYTVVVKEVYCGGCNLFVGHQFEDGRAKGDTHPDARWRH